MNFERKNKYVYLLDSDILLKILEEIKIIKILEKYSVFIFKSLIRN